MFLQTKWVSLEEFEEMVAATDPDLNLEWIDGKIFEDMASNSKLSICAALILAPLVMHVLEKDLGRVTGADGGYMVDTARLIPDVAFISNKRQPIDPEKTYNPLMPDFAVEVISPSDLEKSTERIEAKLQKYQDAKIPLLWLVFPERQEVEVYEGGQLIKTVGIDDILDGGAVLPGFTLPIKNIFR
jgi:Uma2 family endonuclease